MGLIRVLLALWVTLIHAYPPLPVNGTTVVYLFFIISGFYMALIWNEKYKNKKNSYKDFILNRLFRIYPAYWFLTFLTVVLYLIMHFYFHTDTYLRDYFFNENLFQKILVIIMNITILIRTDYLSIDTIRNAGYVITATWTLVLELIFYIVAPYFATKNWKTLLMWIAGSMLIRLSIMAYHARIHDHYLWTRFPLANIYFFLLGILSYKLYVHIKTKVIRKKILLGAYIGMLAFLLSWMILPSITIHWILVKEWVLYVFLIVALPFIFLYTKKSKFDSVVASFSYPIYLSNQFIATLLLVIFPTLKLNSPSFVMLVVAGTIVFSVFITYAIDRPIDAWRHKTFNS